jgi:hypothetical protein
MVGTTQGVAVSASGATLHSGERSVSFNRDHALAAGMCICSGTMGTRTFREQLMIARL